MLILPEQNACRTKLLLPVPDAEWREPSRGMYKDQFGHNGERTYFYIKAMTRQKRCKWHGRFISRYDFDAFLWALFTGSLAYERELWRLPRPHWHPDIAEGELLEFAFATITFFTTADGNFHAVARPSDWDPNNNSIEGIGPGASGGARSTNTGSTSDARGGAGGSWFSLVNWNNWATGSGSWGYSVCPGGAGVSAAVGSGTNGSFSATGGTGIASSLWTDSTITNFASAGRGAPGGQGISLGGPHAGGAPQASSGNGSVTLTNSALGGAGGTVTSLGSNVPCATGGGGAAGSNPGAQGYPCGTGVAGNDGATVAGSSSVAGAGGDGDGSNSMRGDGGLPTSPGANGYEWDSLPHGTGGGGGGSITSDSGAGGTYGAGSGGCCRTGVTANSANAGQGIVVMMYIPMPFGGISSSSPAVVRRFVPVGY